MSFDIRQADKSDISALYDLYDKVGKSDDGFFEACFEKNCVILIVAKEDNDIGFGVLNFEPKYTVYKKLGIPEIQDMNVVPEARQQGAANALLTAFEDIAGDRGAEQVAISVGLSKDYGPAQRIYVKNGYIPDGYGVTYDREYVEKGQSYPLDDDIALMMIKDI